MARRQLLTAALVAAIVVLALIYLIPGRDDQPDQQAPPHAIDQSG